MKKLLFTGGDGFIGKNAIPILKNIYAVHTLGLGDQNDYDIDLTKGNHAFADAFDIVLHAAGKAHLIPKTEEESKAFYEVNFYGTVSLCKCLEKFPPKSFVFLSTVAVYGCENGEMITEEHPLDGITPYAKSKIMAEIFLIDWCNENNVNLTILRPALLVGPNPPGNLGSMINGIKSGRYLSIGGGKARKSVALASDIARIVPLAETKGGIFNLCDDHNPSLWELEQLISKQLKKKRPLSIPFVLAVALAKVGDFLGPKAPINTSKLAKISKSLTFSNKKIKTELNFSPGDVLSDFEIM